MLGILVALGTTVVRAQEVEVTASVDATTVGIEDQVQLTITVSGRDSGQTGPPRLPPLQGFQLLAGPSVSTQFQWINGQTSSTKSFTYTLAPEREGKLGIDPVELTVAGKTYRTGRIDVEVVSGSVRPARRRTSIFDPFGDLDPRAARAPRTTPDVRVEAELDRREVYVGQQVTLNYTLYTQVTVTGLQLQESSPLTGFWVEDLQVDPTPVPARRVVGGREYRAFVVKKQALFPNTPGKLKIPPASFAVEVRVPGEEFFSLLGTRETLLRATKETTLEVKPLPTAGRPPGFTSAVGSFKLSASLDKPESVTGDAVSLRVRLEGRGNLKVISDLPLPPMPDFSVYSSKRSFRALGQDQLGGERTWEHVIVPKAPGRQVIPPISFAYFDPDSGRYVTVSSQPLELLVKKGAAADPTVTSLGGAGKQPLARQGSDIHFIKLSESALRRSEPPPYRRAWFYGLALLSLVFNAAVFLYERERQRTAGDDASIRRRRARRAARSRLSAAVKASRVDVRRPFDEAAGALSRYLADRFALPEIALTSDALERALSEKSVDPETLREIGACLQECDFRRFVSASGSPEEVRTLARRIERLIGRLERL